uniref:Leucine-rich repeat-containing N-terminal plant-type domain-containing protein n=1 Tax=Salix viminalis TaxID=40686 RepID=A0A6N2M8S7_SALVM
MLPSFFFAYSASTGAEVANGRKEAEALLDGSQLDNHSQSLLSSWAGDSHCNWFGISCDRSGSVINISLPDSSLRGTLNSLRFCSFPNLIELILSNNSLYGSIPSHIGNWNAEFTFSTIFECKLSRRIDPGFHRQLEPLNSSLSPITYKFWSIQQSFHGPIPKSLKNCSSLLRLRLERNQLNGSISDAFGTHPHLSYMDLSDNELHETKSLEKYQLLSERQLISKFLTSRQINRLGNLKLIDLALNDNKLSGDIPFDVASLSDLERLGLAANNFSATILKQLGKCSKLIFLNMSKNRFAGEFLLRWVFTVSSNLDLSWNYLMGGIASELGQLQRLEF